ncbi:MAG: hypothetical protein B7Z55_17015 [Planctomycetales bacterium 12-60-4]|nr:MAG: hypothetical protein B7Z55_17015 [Planctomycetales bacterium 12-60-4]
MPAKKATTKKTSTKTSESAATKNSKARQPDEKFSQLDAAAKVLAETGSPLNAKEMVEAMGAKSYWSSPNGQTPAATLCAAILREIQKEGPEAPFEKVDRGQFQLRSAKATPKAKSGIGSKKAAQVVATAAEPTRSAN